MTPACQLDEEISTNSVNSSGNALRDSAWWIARVTARAANVRSPPRFFRAIINTTNINNNLSCSALRGPSTARQCVSLIHTPTTVAHTTGGGRGDTIHTHPHGIPPCMVARSKVAVPLPVAQHFATRVLHRTQTLLCVPPPHSVVFDQH